MNYYDPFLFANPAIYQTATLPKVGLLQRIFGGGISFSNILNGTQRTLNIVNQAIPLIQQAKPIVSNAKTMFQVMNEFKRVDIKEKPVSNKQVNQINQKTEEKKEPTNYSVEAGPMFFQ